MGVCRSGCETLAEQGCSLRSSRKNGEIAYTHPSVRWTRAVYKHWAAGNVLMSPLIHIVNVQKSVIISLKQLLIAITSLSDCAQQLQTIKYRFLTFYANFEVDLKAGQYNVKLSFWMYYRLSVTPCLNSHMYWYVFELMVCVGGKRCLLCACVFQCVWQVLDVRGWIAVNITNARGTSSWDPAHTTSALVSTLGFLSKLSSRAFQCILKISNNNSGISLQEFLKVYIV